MFPSNVDIMSSMIDHLCLQLIVNGMSTVHGVAVLLHVEEDNNHVQDP